MYWVETLVIFVWMIRCHWTRPDNTGAGFRAAWTSPGIISRLTTCAYLVNDHLQVRTWTQVPSAVQRFLQLATVLLCTDFCINLQPRTVEFTWRLPLLGNTISSPHGEGGDYWNHKGANGAVISGPVFLAFDKTICLFGGKCKLKSLKMHWSPVNFYLPLTSDTVITCWLSISKQLRRHLAKINAIYLNC